MTDAQIERVLNGNPCSLDSRAKEIIVKNGRAYTERILSSVMEAGFDLRAMQIVDNSRRLLFLAAPEIHWYANVWYMERFHLAEDRLNPSNPVLRLTFIDVANRKKREILQKYAQYHVGIGSLTIGNIRQQLYEIKRLMQYFDAEESICEVDTKKLDSYFKVLDEKDTKEATFNTRIAHIKKFYEFLKVNSYVKEIPFQDSYYYKKTFPEHHDRTVEERIYMEILSKLYSFPLELRLIFLHLWCTGLRSSEVCTLKGAAYSWDGEDAWLKIYQIKMKAEKMIPIPLVLYKIMQTYISKKHIRPKEYIFKAQDGKAYRYGTFMKNFKTNVKNLELPIVSMYLRAMITDIPWRPSFMIMRFHCRQSVITWDIIQKK